MLIGKKRGKRGQGNLEYIFKILLWIAIFALLLGGVYLLYRKIAG